MTATGIDDRGDSAESPRDELPADSMDGPGSFTERLTLIENGLEALAGRLDDTEDTIATTLETICGEIADLKANLAQLLAQEREPIKPRRWAARARHEDWNNLVDWVDQAQQRLLAAQRLHDPALLASAPRRRRGTRRPLAILGPRGHR